MKILTTIIFFILFSFNLNAKLIVNIKHSSISVDLNNSNFEDFHKPSSFIGGAWYDKKYSYLIIKLNGVYYHYCGLPVSTWSDFKEAPSLGKFYNQYIKEKFDCRFDIIPDYNE